MSHIVIHPVSEEERERRLVHRIQHAALAPHAPGQQKEWDFTRRAWVHGWVGWRRSDAIASEEAPIRREVRRAAMEQGIDPALVDAVPLDEFVVLPDVIETPIEGLRWVARPGLRALLRREQELAELTESGPVEIVSLNFGYRFTAAGQRYWTSTPIPAPCRIKEVAWSTKVQIINIGSRANLSIEGTPFNLVTMTTDNSFGLEIIGDGTGRFAPNYVSTLVPVSLRYEAYAAGSDEVGLVNAVMAVERLRRRRE